MKQYIHPPLVVLILFLGTRLYAEQCAIINLNNGDNIGGVLMSNDDFTISLRQAFIGKTGKVAWAEITHDKSQVKSFSIYPDIESEFKSRKKSLTEVVKYERLITWCLVLGKTEWAIEVSSLLLEREKNNIVAERTLLSLGMVLVENQWVKETDWLDKQGKVKVNGEILTKEQYKEMRDNFERARTEANEKRIRIETKPQDQAQKTVNRPTTISESVVKQEKKIYEREEFRKLLKGLKAEKIIAILGAPDSTQQMGGSEYWYYYNITRDAINGKTDSMVQIILANHYVLRINF